jgi:hypothetical protein
MNIPKVIETRPPIQVQEAQLGEFIATGAVTHIRAKGNRTGFELHIDIGSASGVLGNSRGVIRTFSSLNTLASLVRRLGAKEFNVAIGDFAADDVPASTAPDKKPRAIASPSSRSKTSVTRPKRQAIGRNK